jgi:hypothetical protein
MKAWRCNLTALSNVHNLYFVACNDTIRVYEPEFPDQTFDFKPSLILHPPISSPDLQPYMDEEHPHSITRILVAYLGNDEVLLATCDDGDVIGYRVEEIHRVLTTRYEDDELPDVKTFLHLNVGMSAWGLAVHREARMIAISANTHEITVIAYALANEDFSPTLSNDEEDDYIYHLPASRKRDIVIMLRANHNVPAVSFNNTSEDPDGRWLFSTCINGEVRLWDLHNPKEPAQIFEMGFCLSTEAQERAPRTALGKCSCENRSRFPHSTWGAMFLDQNAAYEIETTAEERKAVDGARFFEDAEGQKERFRGKEGDVDEALTDCSMEDEDGEMELSDYGSESEDDDLDVLDAHEMGENYVFPASDPGTYDDDDEDGDEHNDGNDDENESDDDQHTETHTYTAPPLPPMQTPTYDPSVFQQALNHFMQIQEANALATALNDEDADSDEGDDDSSDEHQQPQPYLAHLNYFANALRYPGILSPRSPTPYYQTSPPITISSPHPSRNPSLIISQDALFLRSPDDPNTPILTLRTPLHPHGLTFVNTQIHRLSFSQYIPELGVFVVASPVGCVGVFAVTKSKSSPAESAASSSSNQEGGGGWNFGFRLEHILSDTPPDYPVAGPGRRLVGVAVGPVQGMFDAQGREWGWGERRWRLMMYFMDHSVMGFELSRKSGSEGIGDLVV